MKIHGAVVKEQGVTFAIVIVKKSSMQTSHESDKTRASMQGLFPGLPIVLASQDSRGLFEYQGRPDLVKFLASIDASRIPWKEYTVS
jgi:hypothetical protein